MSTPISSWIALNPLRWLAQWPQIWPNHKWTGPTSGNEHVFCPSIKACRPDQMISYVCYYVYIYLFYSYSNMGRPSSCLRSKEELRKVHISLWVANIFIHRSIPYNHISPCAKDHWTLQRKGELTCIAGVFRASKKASFVIRNILHKKQISKTYTTHNNSITQNLDDYLDLLSDVQWIIVISNENHFISITTQMPLNDAATYGLSPQFNVDFQGQKYCLHPRLGPPSNQSIFFG